MKQGDEPLRSFSDLMQFYESKRTESTGLAGSGQSPAESNPPPANSDPSDMANA
jgi:hypothetical protein